MYDENQTGIRLKSSNHIKPMNRSHNAHRRRILSCWRNRPKSTHHHISRPFKQIDPIRKRNETHVSKFTKNEQGKLYYWWYCWCVSSKWCHRLGCPPWYTFWNSSLIFIVEHRGQPDGMVISHFPHGPTAYFSLHNVVFRHDIPDSGTVSEQFPHLIFEKVISITLIFNWIVFKQIGY